MVLYLCHSHGCGHDHHELIDRSGAIGGSGSGSGSGRYLHVRSPANEQSRKYRGPICATCRSSGRGNTTPGRLPAVPVSHRTGCTHAPAQYSKPIHNGSNRIPLDNREAGYACSLCLIHEVTDPSWSAATSLENSTVNFSSVLGTCGTTGASSGSVAGSGSGSGRDGGHSNT